ncbi:MAG TPA: tRNA (adenosine(37)-N6)-dimethylallyltransferase MiaA [Gammaproteobacteria bacterium]|nr:tRNA (adenosine(37)-N6)-dimethylallyltransferase MiaA [Gammaproteobacteria bacterium]
MSAKPPVLCVMGPTASGKTELAVNLVRRLPCEIVSVDSAMVYRGMDIGTAKPDRALLREAPHRLIDICDPAQAYSAARFRADALREMELIRAAGRLPVLVGGTMLYFRALEQGLSQLPSADPRVREALDEEARKVGWAALHARLARVDPQAAGRIHPNDPQRIQRALEVHQITGRPLTEWFARRGPVEPPFRFIKLIVAPGDRALLHRRIAARFQTMLSRGFADEVRRLRERGDLHQGLPSMRAVGYRQVWDYLDGKLGRDAMVERAVTATRQYAKRQLTWLRAETGGTWYDALDPRLTDKVLKRLDRLVDLSDSN